MGLVFVLLIGEIDLSAGFTAGVGGRRARRRRHPARLPWWLGVLGLPRRPVRLIGLVIGVLVSRVGIPSFVVTLAGFLGLQGLLLQIIGEGGTIRIQSETVLAIMSKNLPVWLGWAMLLLVVGAAMRGRVVPRRCRTGGPAAWSRQTPSVWLAKVVSMAVLLGVCTYYLSIERSRNDASPRSRASRSSSRWCWCCSCRSRLLLSRTVFGRHVYAVGGNAEAARRAGINVARVRLLCFVLCSTIAAFAGVLLASRVNSVSPNTGGGETLLYAVGAAVIGGTSLFGGKGRPVDAIIGGLVVAVVANGMGCSTRRPPSSTWSPVCVLLLAAGVDALSRRRAAASGRG